MTEVYIGWDLNILLGLGIFIALFVMLRSANNNSVPQNKKNLADLLIVFGIIITLLIGVTVK